MRKTTKLFLGFTAGLLLLCGCSAAEEKLGTAFPLLYTYLVKPGLLSFPRLMELLHDAPCRRFGLPQGELDGPHADFTVFDLSASYPIDPADFLSQGKATPFTGWPVQARCLLTVCDGRPVWQDGELFSKEDRT